MRIIREDTVEVWTKREPRAAASLQRWLDRARRSAWTRFQDVRASFPGADQVIVASGNPVVVFNIGGNNYRLITAIHYNRNRVFVLKFMTHAEYDKNLRKGEL